MTKEDILFGTTKLFLRDYADYRINLAYKKRLTYLRLCVHKVASAFFRNKYNKQKRLKKEKVQTIARYLITLKHAKFL